MPVSIISESGPQHGLVVNPDGSLNVNFTGSIMIGSVSAQVDSIYIQSGNNVHLGSAWTNVGSIVISGTSIPPFRGVGSVLITNQYLGSETWIKAGSVQTYNPVGVGSSYLAGGLGSVYIAGGSITSMPTINVTTGSESYIKGGSISVYNMVAGSIVYMPNVSVTAGSESWIKGGSVAIYGTATPGLLGSIYVVNPLTTISGVVSGNDIATQVKSVLVALRPDDTYANIISTQNGEVKVSVESWDGAIGSVYTLNRVAGSIVDMPIVGVSGTNFSNMIGSVRSQNVQITSPWVVSGNMLVSGTINIGNQYLGSETWIKAGSIQTYTPLGSTFVIGSVYTTGSITITNLVNPGSVYVTNHSWYEGSESWIKAGSVQTYSPLGSTYILGSVYATGSINIATTLLPISGNVLISGAVNQGTTPWQVAGSIWSMPSISVSVGSESYIKGGSIQTYSPLGSTFILGSIYSTGSIVISSANRIGVSGIVDITTRVAGSIVNMPIVGVSGTNFSTIIGSVRAQAVQITDPWQIAGSIWSMPSVSVTTGSEVYIKGGSLEGVSQFAGSIWSMPDVSVTTGSEQWIKGGSMTLYDLGSNAYVIGSVAITNIGSFYFAGGVGSVMISGTSQPVWKGIGSVLLTGVGSVVISGVQGPWSGVGSNYLLQNQLPQIGSWTGMSNGSIWFGGGVGSIMLSGTLPLWTGVGSVHIGTGIGSVYVAGFNDDIMANIGSPCFKTSILIASGGYSNTWPIGGAGSRLAIHGWHISTNTPGTIRLLISGTTNTAAISPGLISEYFLYYASGATIEKTFSTPLIPAGAGSAIGFGATNAGSTTVTIFGREVK